MSAVFMAGYRLSPIRTYAGKTGIYFGVIQCLIFAVKRRSALFVGLKSQWITKVISMYFCILNANFEGRLPKSGQTAKVRKCRLFVTKAVLIYTVRIEND
ncbi:hypothetical protein TSAR_003190 [Trichomalopsis sarcophagae]|uniref:Uncharacterized protein n=1 Tax=Trichomalopsis sarcophagae TaxID=543379 RepID=A0A232F903_9HYME|nr:hypothetical protein TSAR_003190 [Trichomalopsis sarcophagae]